MSQHQSGWSIASDNPNQSENYNMINPISVSRGEPPIRSRNQSSHSRSKSSSSSRSSANSTGPGSILSPNTNNLSKSLSRVAIANVLSVQEDVGVGSEQNQHQTRSILSTEALMTQKIQMQKNNDELKRYMLYKKELEDKIKELEKDNQKLRFQRSQGIVPEPNYVPQSHAKQRVINELHEAICKSQKDYDQKVEQINEVNYKTESLQKDIKGKLEKANNLQKERENQQRKANAHRLQVPPKEDEKERLEQQIAKNEADFQNAYSELMMRLAQVKPIEIPDQATRPTGEMQQVHLDHLKQQMLRIRREIQEINDNMSRNRELAKLREDKEKLEKANDSMNKQSNLLEKKIDLITEESIETKRHTAAKKAEVENLKKAYDEDMRDHEGKMRRLHAQYKSLYDKYHSILNDITDQKERATQHKSIKAELEEMRRLLNMKRLSIASTGRGY